MLLRALGAWDLSVRDVAHEQVLERVLGFTLDRAPPRTLHELLLLQRVQLLLRRVERAEPEHLSDDRGVLQDCLLLAPAANRGARR